MELKSFSFTNCSLRHLRDIWQDILSLNGFKRNNAIPLLWNHVTFQVTSFFKYCAYFKPGSTSAEKPGLKLTHMPAAHFKHAGCVIGSLTFNYTPYIFKSSLKLWADICLGPSAGPGRCIFTTEWVVMENYTTRWFLSTWVFFACLTCVFFTVTLHQP